MKTSDNRKAAFLVLAAISLSFIGLAGPVAGAQTLDITGLRLSPNPGYACDNTTISFNVTNNLGTMVDFATVSVAAKSSVGGMSWQSNITLFADGATSFQSFVWTNPPEGTYDVSITVFGAGQIAQKSGVYTVLPCAAHVYIGSVTIVKSAIAPDSATLTVDVQNDGHAPAYNTTVAVQATGPYSDKTRYFLGSTVVPEIAANGASHPDFMWAPMPAPGVYTVTVMTIDQNGVMMSKEVSLVVDLMPRPNTVEIKGISVDPWPPMHGQESTVTAELLFSGNWTGVPVTVMAYADGPSSYKLYNITLKEVFVTGVMAVNFTWPADIEPGQYNLTVTAQFNPREYTVSKIAVTQLAKQKSWLPANFRLELKSLKMSPYPALPGQNATVMVEVANTGDADAPPAKLTVTAEGPTFYNLGTRTTPSTSFGTMVRMEFNWTQPIVPGEYTIRAFLEDAGGNQSELRKTYPMPHILESNLSVVNGSATYNYYYFGAQPNNTCDHNVTVTVRQTGNGTAAAEGLNNPTTGAVIGIAVGSVVGAASMGGYLLGKRRGRMTDVQSNPMYKENTNQGQNPMYKENANQGQNPMYQEKGMAGESPLHIHERMVHGVHMGEGVSEPQEATLVGGAVPGGAVISSAVSSKVRESPSRPSTGHPVGRESPTRASLGQTSIRESPTRAATVTDADGDASSDARMAINEKGLPGKKKPSTQRLAGDGTEPVDPDSDDDGVPDVQGMAINEKGLPGDKKPKKTSSHARTAGGEPLDDDSDDDGLSDGTERKGWDGTVKGSTKADEAPEGTNASNPIPGIGIVVKRGADYSSALRESPTKASLGQTAVRESPTRASGLRESPTKASTGVVAPRDAASGQASGKRQHGALDDDDDGDGVLTAEERKGWDGKVKGGKFDEAGPEAASKKGYDYYQAQSQLNSAAKVRESPTRATVSSTRDSVSSVAQTAGSSPAGEPMGIRESPTRASGLRESPTLPSKGQTSVRESPTASDFAIKEQGVKSSQTAPPAGDLDGDGVADLRAQNNNTVRSNRIGNAFAPEGPGGTTGGGGAPELRGGGYGTTRSNRTDNPAAPDPVMKEEGGRHTPFQNKLAPEEAAGVDGIKGHRDVGGYRAAEATEGSGGGTRAQDHNSSRSNKTASTVQDADGDMGSDDAAARRRVEVLKSNKQGDPDANRVDSGGGSRSQDHNSSRSNKTNTVAAPDGDGGTGTGSGGTGSESKLTPADLEAQKHNKTGHVTLMK